MPADREPDAETVRAIVAGLSDLERELLTGSAPGWGSWMFSVAGDLARKGLMVRRGGSYDTTPLGLAVADAIERGEPFKQR